MRQAKLVVVVGQKEIGKTRTTIAFLRKNAKGDPANGIPGRKVLIFDTQNEYANKEWYPDIYTLPVDKISLYAANQELNIRRISPFKRNGDEMTPDEKCTVVLHILQYFTNGILLMEDTNDYIYDNMSQDIVGKILSQRHKGLDLYLHYHSLGRIQKKIWPHINFLRMHKCGDAVIDNKDKFPDKFECFKIAESIVSKQYLSGNTQFYLYIEMAKQLIRADISDEDRDIAINQYLSDFYNKKIKPLTDARGMSGEKKYDIGGAFKFQLENMINTYFTMR